MSELVRVSKTRCQGHQDPSRSVSIFDREIEANVKMVSIGSVSIPRSRTVCIYISYASLLSVYSPIHHTDNRRQTFLTIGRAKP